MNRRLRAGDVLAAAGVDPHPLALLDEERHLDDDAGLEGGGLGASTRSGVPLQAGIGLRDRQVHGARRLRAGGPLVDEEQLDVGVRRHPPEGVIDDRLGDLDLVIALVVHEDRGLVRVVEELHLAVLGAYGPELLTGLEGLVDHGAVIDALQLRANEGAALTGLDVLELDDAEDPAVDLDVGAVLELVRRNHEPRRLATAPLLGGRPRAPGDRGNSSLPSKHTRAERPHPESQTKPPTIAP